MKNTYREMKDSGMAWIGAIPKQWDTLKLKYAAWLKGRIGWQGLKANEYTDTGAHLITGTDFKNGKINWDTCAHISMERFNEDTDIHIKEKDLLITKDGTVGKVAVAYNCPPYVSLNSGIMLIRNNRKYKYIDRFLYYTLLSEEFLLWYDLSQNGASTIKHLYQEQFYNFEFAYPTLPEQTAIAAYLDEKCGTIDEIIAEAKASIEEYKAWKSSVIFEAVTKGLDPHAEMKDSGVEWIGKVPKTWKVTSLKRVSRIQTGNTPSKQSQENYYSDDDGTPWIKADNLGTCNSIETTSEYLTAKGVEAARLNPENTVYVCCIGTIGKTGFSTQKCTCNQQINAVVFNDLMFWKFGFYSICAQEEQHWFYANGNVLKILNTENQKNIKITIPPMKEQRCIVDYLDEKCAAIDGIIAEKEALIADMEVYKKSLIFETVTGKRKVC